MFFRGLGLGGGFYGVVERNDIEFGFLVIMILFLLVRVVGFYTGLVGV